MSYNTTTLELYAKQSDNQVWVIIFDGKIIEGAKKRAFNTKGSAKSSFSHMVYEPGRKSSQIREELERSGRLEFKNLGNSW